MLMSGHEGEVYCCKFHPNGATLASSGFDRLICKILIITLVMVQVVCCSSLSFLFAVVLWNVYGDCENYATLKGHSGAVMELHYNTDGR